MEDLLETLPEKILKRITGEANSDSDTDVDDGNSEEEESDVESEEEVEEEGEKRYLGCLGCKTHRGRSIMFKHTEVRKGRGSQIEYPIVLIDLFDLISSERFYLLPE